MERPKVDQQPIKRQVTGEIVYLDEMRRSGEFPDKFSTIGEQAIDMYSHDAKIIEAQGQRPDIMDLYEEYEPQISSTEASCIALADELLKLKKPGNTLTFVDVRVETPAAEVLNKLQSMKAGELITADDDQLAIESNGEYHPILDIRKNNAKLDGAKLRIWGWDHTKYVLTSSDIDPSDAYLGYPSDEKIAERKLEIFLLYKGIDSEDFSEHISLTLNSTAGAYLSRSIYSSAYAEMGYSGHNDEIVYDIEEADIAAFGDLVAEIVGDEPEAL